jgi:hypothetical protein
MGKNHSGQEPLPSSSRADPSGDRRAVQADLAKLSVSEDQLMLS